MTSNDIILTDNDTICAVSTPPGIGGIAVIRVSGSDAFEITSAIWKGRRFDNMDSHTLALGEIVDSDGNTVDQCVAALFRGPKSYSGQDTVELSVHGSEYIQHQVLKLLIDNGARLAKPGEFTRRAFTSGNIDLPKAEAIADLLAADSKQAHRLAMSQLKGNFSNEINTLRQKLINLAALLELELDFAEEDVEFASRKELIAIASEILNRIKSLTDTFATAQAVKNGIPVAIIGRPNAGKSTLLNTLLNDDKAIVSDIPGTTRDVIEGTAQIDGVTYRFADTAGIRSSEDPIEIIGVQKAMDNIAKSKIILLLIPAESFIQPNINVYDQIHPVISQLKTGTNPIVVITKSDLLDYRQLATASDEIKSILSHIRQPEQSLEKSFPIISISAKNKNGINNLLSQITESSDINKLRRTNLAVTNLRHYETLCQASNNLNDMMKALQTGLSTDLVAFHLRAALDDLSSVTGQISSDTVLHTIFHRFCIGK